MKDSAVKERIGYLSIFDVEDKTFLMNLSCLFPLYHQRAFLSVSMHPALTLLIRTDPVFSVFAYATSACASLKTEHLCPAGTWPWSSVRAREGFAL